MFVESTAPSFTSTNKKDVIDKNSMITDHIEIGLKLAWKLLNSWQSRLPQEEVKSIVGISLCEAASNYDGRPNVQFQTFLYYYLRGRLLREITECVKVKNMSTKMQHPALSNFQEDCQEDVSEYYLGLDFNNAEKILIENEERIIIEQSFHFLDTLEKEVIMKHYFDGESLIDLAKSLGYCRCHLSRVKTRALNKLKRSMSVKYDTNKDLSDKQNVISNVKIDSYTGGRGRRKFTRKNESLVKSKKHKMAA
jgi:RNA polymerase sigma factor (sigma-70 family)